MGYRALRDSTGSDNTALGNDAGYLISSGQSNTIIGSTAGDAITTGINNCFLGYRSGTATTVSSYNVAIGEASLLTNILGSKSVAIGDGALYTQNIGTATDMNNVAVGFSAGASVTTGISNVFIGANSGSNVTTGGGNIIIGDADGSDVGTAHQIIIGNSVVGVGQDNFTFGRATLDSNIAFGATTISAPSDERLKEDIQDEKIGLDFINELRPVTFQWKKAKDVPSEMKAHSDSEERVMNGKYNHGFIAQEVKSVLDKYDIKDGFGMWLEETSDGSQRIAEGELMSILVKSIQELSAKNEALEARLSALENG